MKYYFHSLEPHSIGGVSFPTATMNLHVAVNSPSSDVTVTVATPPPTAVTTPLSTVTISSFEDSHVTFLLVALAGVNVTSRFTMSPR